MSNTGAKKRILVVEDDLHLAEGLKLNFSLAGYEVEIAATGQAAVAAYRERRPDLMVLDVMLPGMDGFSVLQNVRLSDQQLPILILSARGQATDKIRGLSMGVDDYMAKPFHLAELMLRVERLLERADRKNAATAAPDNAPEVHEFGGNRVDLTNYTATCQSGTITLSEQEVRLLRLFFANPGKPMARSELLELAWGYSGKSSTRTVDNFLVRFRKYFEADPKNPRFFKSLRSVGYVFDDKG
ncbi:MAG: response regulator transcription factor [Thermodesulfobacteriota bacterium]